MAEKDEHVFVKMVRGLTNGVLPRVRQQMACSAESDQVVFGVVAALTSMLFVMDL